MTKYRILKKGELIQDGDEADASRTMHDDAKWQPVAKHSIGKPASDPRYPAHTIYRRRVTAQQELTLNEQISIMESQINSPDANFTLAEKLAHIVQIFDNDPMFSKKARDIVRGNLAKGLQP